MNTLLVIDELGAAASVPGQLAKLVSGYRILYLSDTKPAPYRILSRSTVAILAMQWLDLFREERPGAVLVASAVMGRVAGGVIRLGRERVGALVHPGAELVSSEVVRAHRFGDIGLLGSALVDAGALEGAVAAAGLGARVVEVVPPDVLAPGRPGNLDERAKTYEAGQGRRLLRRRGSGSSARASREPRSTSAEGQGARSGAARHVSACVSRWPKRWVR